VSKYWRLIVSYDANTRSKERDAYWASVVGKDSEGSGVGFGLRDLEFYFDTEQDALDAEQRVRKLKDAETDIMDFGDD
jgi:hypothetical protein